MGQFEEKILVHQCQLQHQRQCPGQHQCVFSNVSCIMNKSQTNATNVAMHLFDFCSLCIFKCLPKWPCCGNFCIVWFFSSVRFQMYPQSACVRRGIAALVAFVFYRVFLNVSPNGLSKRMHNHIDYICLTFLLCAFSNVSSKYFNKMHIVTLIAFIWLFSTVHFQICPQIICIRGCKVTLIAFVWLFSVVCFPMGL